MPIKESELILNPDGSVYHLNLRPEHIANTIITVGDPDRVDMVTAHFDSIEFTTKKREFHTKTGYYKGKRLTVISTGIGTDNIDIVFNELDALVNINLKTREINNTLKTLKFVRIGTSGSIQEDVPLNAFLISERAIGFDSLLQFYDSVHVQDIDFSEALQTQLNLSTSQALPYVVNGNSELISKLHSNTTILGNTISNAGFYGPQGRVLRLPLENPNLNTALASFNYKHQKITNLEMETAGIYGLSKLLGHKAVSMNAIIANRKTGEFSKKPEQLINDLINYTLDRLTA